MKKRIFAILCLLTLSLCLVPRALAAVEPDREASLTLLYQKDGQGFGGLPIAIYRVARAEVGGSFTLLAPYDSCPVSIYDITRQAQWTEVTDTLYSCIVSQGVRPTGLLTTDSEGKAAFTGLQTGLYLVEEAVAENNSGTYLFNRFMVYLPTPTADGFDYGVEARPKCTEFVPKTAYRVTKLWQGGDTRPAQIIVDLYKDGALQDSQLLSAENDWTYTWYVSQADPGRWTVAEREVPKGYTVTLRQQDATFTLINTKAGSKPPVPPQTGDSANLPLYMIAMAISGLLLMVLGIYGRRRKG